MKAYSKFIVAIVAAVAAFGVAYQSGQTVTTNEWITVGLAFASALGVYAAKNA